MNAVPITLIITIGLVLIAFIIYGICSAIASYKSNKWNYEIELKKADAKKMYFTFESDDDKTIKAFRIVVDKNVNIEDFVECSERYTDPLFEYNMNHQRLNKDEFDLLKEVLKDEINE